MDFTSGTTLLIFGLLIVGHVSAAVALLRRFLAVPFKAALAACLCSDAAAGALMTGVYLVGGAVTSGLEWLANLAAGNSLSADFLGTTGLQIACLAGFLTLRAALIPPLVGRAGRLLHMEGVPLVRDGRRGLKLAAWTLLSAAATVVLAAGAWVAILGAAVVNALLGGH